VALAEGDLLDTLITDAYATPAAMRQPWLPARLRAKLAERRADGLPPERVKALWGTTILEHTRHALGFSPRLTWQKLDARFGEAAADQARRARAHLLMYSPYAWEAFTASYPHTPKRVLFQYHPHPDLEARLLDEDRRRFPAFGESFSDGDEPDAPAQVSARERDSWRHADAIICSSTFTRRSLIEAGCDERVCHVVPYGIDLPADQVAGSTDGPFEALFVGSAGQRKGLHHLLLAWQQASLPNGSRLTIVCRVIDRGIETLAAGTSGVRIRRDVDARERDAVYARSHLMVMPSLVEGFGQVYLEALARGCPVLGTPHTALPDLGGEADGIFVTAAGDVAQLTARLETLASAIPARPELRRAARAAASRFRWATFRRRVREVATP
jgi:glycosyltransferase involved in cell wall biosynthesis